MPLCLGGMDGLGFRLEAGYCAASERRRLVIVETAFASFVTSDPFGALMAGAFPDGRAPPNGYKLSFTFKNLLAGLVVYTYWRIFYCSFYILYDTFETRIFCLSGPLMSLKCDSKQLKRFSGLTVCVSLTICRLSKRTSSG